MNRTGLVLVLSIVLAAAVAGCSAPSDFDRTGTAEELAKTIAIGADHVSAAELSDWIIKDRRDYELLDIREKEDFDAGHIEGARNVPLAGLMSEASLAALPQGHKIVVYSNGTGHAAQAALLLRLVERDGYALLGGYNYWQAYMNDPEAAGVAEMDPRQRAAYQAVACRFAGDYVAAAGLTPEPQTGQVPAAPAPAADPLGLGLGLGLGTPAVQPAAPSALPATQRAADPLGLGLGLGLGPDAVKDSQPKPKASRLLIKAEC